jgi:dephospho-CoA kinase
MIVVGLTGGIAAGKSTVAAMLAARGAALVDADRIGHALQEPGGRCHQAIVEAFGKGILDEHGHIDRRRLGKLVFADLRLRRTLEAIMHPAIWEACEAAIRAAEAAGRPVCVVEAAVLLEAGWEASCDAVAVVTAPEAVRVARLMRARGLSEAEERQRVEAQWTQAAQAARADCVIDNGGDPAATEAQAARAYAQLAATPIRRAEKA